MISPVYETDDDANDEGNEEHGYAATVPVRWVCRARLNYGAEYELNGWTHVKIHVCCYSAISMLMLYVVCEI